MFLFFSVLTAIIFPILFHMGVIISLMWMVLETEAQEGWETYPGFHSQESQFRWGNWTCRELNRLSARLIGYEGTRAEYFREKKRKREEDTLIVEVRLQNSSIMQQIWFWRWGWTCQRDQIVDILNDKTRVGFLKKAMTWWKASKEDGVGFREWMVFTTGRK